MLANCLLDSPGLVSSIAGIRDGAIAGVFRIRHALAGWELQGYDRLRHIVFCKEQGLFTDSDKDEHDARALPLVAISFAGGMADEVVGAVRIYPVSSTVWYGSRLAVARDWRGVQGLATALIRAAVFGAQARGCETFLATVQRQNVPLFRRLRWGDLGEVQVRGRPHRLMQANLAFETAQRRLHAPMPGIPS